MTSPRFVSSVLLCWLVGAACSGRIPLIPENTGPTIDGCVQGCRDIRAYPEDRARGCVDTTRSERVGCDCNPMFGGNPGCLRWRADGSVWMSQSTDELLWTEGSEPARRVDGGWEECSPEDRKRLGVACDFAGCAQEPPSTCSATDTCQTLAQSWNAECAGVSTFGSDGCLRSTCSTNADCPSGKACFTDDCVTLPSCSYGVGGLCTCGADPVCRSRSYCIATELAGRWKSFSANMGAGPCPPDKICQWTWKVDPTGALVMSKEGVASTAQLSVEDLREVERRLMSAEFRTGMKSGFACDPPPTDVSVGFQLELPSETLMRDVTGCAEIGPAGNPAKVIWTALSKY